MEVSLASGRAGNDRPCALPTRPNLRLNLEVALLALIGWLESIGAYRGFLGRLAVLLNAQATSSIAAVART
jgi:hypothetical protein